MYKRQLLDRALLWLHEQEIIRLNKGLAVFRPAMTIRLEPDWKNKFMPADFAPLKLHYDEQVVQIHVMAEYVQRGLKAMAEALHLTMDYFSLPRDEFMRRWLPDRDKELARQTTPQSWHDIVAVSYTHLDVYKRQILPRLERDIPSQPSAEVLAAEPLRHRFTLVFDREGYSPELFKRLKARRVACLSYRKYPGDDWSPEEFVEGTIELRSGERVRMRLAERGTLLGGVVWVREVRKLCDTGRQVSLISTDYQSGMWLLAATLFARWSQENFFKRCV